jgi:hypothetical protein
MSRAWSNGPETQDDHSHSDGHDDSDGHRH